MPQISAVRRPVRAWPPVEPIKDLEPCRSHGLAARNPRRLQGWRHPAEESGAARHGRVNTAAGSLDPRPPRRCFWFARTATCRILGAQPRQPPVIEIRSVSGETLVAVPVGHGSFREFLADVGRSRARLPPADEELEDADWPASTPSLADVDLDDLAASASCAGVPGTLTLEGMLDLREIDLSGWNLRGVRANRADLSGASLVAAVADEASLAGARLSGADLSGTSLRGVVLERSDLRRCICHRAPDGHPALAMLSHSCLGKVRCQGMGTDRTDLIGVHLAGADLRGADIDGGLMLAADLSAARMDGCRLTGCDLTGTNFRATVLDLAVICSRGKTRPLQGAG